MDATAEKTPRRSGQSQGDTKGEISEPRSHNVAMLAKTKTTGESGRTLGRKLSHSATDKNIGVGLQRDTTAWKIPRRSGQIQGDTKETLPRPKGKHKAAVAKTKTIGGPTGSSSQTSTTPPPRRTSEHCFGSLDHSPGR